MAVNRAIMDQANTIVLRQKLEDAKAAAARGDLPGAAKLYEDAKALVDQIGSGIDAETAQTISGLVGHVAGDSRARINAPAICGWPTRNVTRALKVDPHNAAAIAFKKENDADDGGAERPDARSGHAGTDSAGGQRQYGGRHAGAGRQAAL